MNYDSSSFSNGQFPNSLIIYKAFFFLTTWNDWSVELAADLSKLPRRPLLNSSRIGDPVPGVCRAQHYPIIYSRSKQKFPYNKALLFFLCALTLLLPFKSWCNDSGFLSFFLGWQRWGEHWELSVLSETFHDLMAQRSGVQCHNCWLKEVRKKGTCIGKYLEHILCGAVFNDLMHDSRPNLFSIKLWNADGRGVTSNGRAA